MPKVEYPKWLYHPNYAPRVVNGPHEHAALGPEWRETPAGEMAAEDAEATATAPEAGAGNSRRRAKR